MRKEWLDELSYQAAARKFEDDKTSDEERYWIARKWGIDFDDHYDRFSVEGRTNGEE